MTKPTQTRPRELTGRHVLMIALGAFGVILAANLTLVFHAARSFPGVVTSNVYVASQGFNAQVAEQARLGWRFAVDYDGALSVTAVAADGAPLPGLEVTAVLGRPADARTDRTLTLAPGAAPNVYTADVALDPGVWRVAVTAANAAGERLAGSANVIAR